MHRNRVAFVQDIFQNWPTAWWGEVSCGFQVLSGSTIICLFIVLIFLCRIYILFSHFILSFIIFLLFFFPLRGTYLLLVSYLVVAVAIILPNFFRIFVHRTVLVFGWAKLLPVDIFTTILDYRFVNIKSNPYFRVRCKN